LFAQTARLVEDLVGDFDLANIVQQGTDTDAADNL